LANLLIYDVVCPSIVLEEGIKVRFLSHNGDSNVPHIANLLTSILIYYPEIATINLDPKTQIIKFTFYLQNIISQDTIRSIENYLHQSLEAYYYLENTNITVSSFAFKQLDSFTILEFRRDVQSLSQKEIALIIALLKELGAFLLTDEDDDLLLDDTTLHEELISYMLENVKQKQANIELIALRDEGKVLVYNK
jgi:hypothetical protein